jgi:heme/copper-type cytochrome/quinol oxidase subunit 2
MLRQTAFISLVTAGLLSALQATDHREPAPQPGTQAEPASATVHELLVVAGRFSYEPATLQVIAGERVRSVIRSKDTVHGFSIPKLHIDKRIPKSGEPVVVEFTAPPAIRERMFRVLRQRTQTDESSVD